MKKYTEATVVFVSSGTVEGAQLLVNGVDISKCVRAINFAVSVDRPVPVVTLELVPKDGIEIVLDKALVTIE